MDILMGKRISKSAMAIICLCAGCSWSYGSDVSDCEVANRARNICTDLVIAPIEEDQGAALIFKIESLVEYNSKKEYVECSDMEMCEEWRNYVIAGASIVECYGVCDNLVDDDGYIYVYGGFREGALGCDDKGRYVLSGISGYTNDEDINISEEDGKEKFINTHYIKNSSLVDMEADRVALNVLSSTCGSYVDDYCPEVELSDIQEILGLYKDIYLSGEKVGLERCTYDFDKMLENNGWPREEAPDVCLE